MAPKKQPWLTTPSKALWVRRSSPTTRLRVMRLLKTIKIKNMIIKRQGYRMRALKVRMNRIKLESEQALKDEHESNEWTETIVRRMEDEISTDTDTTG